jgi:hypothetical protein
MQVMHTDGVVSSHTLQSGEGQAAHVKVTKLL